MAAPRRVDLRNCVHIFLSDGGLVEGWSANFTAITGGGRPGQLISRQAS